MAGDGRRGGRHVWRPYRERPTIRNGSASLPDDKQAWQGAASQSLLFQRMQGTSEERSFAALRRTGDEMDIMQGVNSGETTAE